jgi:hypothetical protein
MTVFLRKISFFGKSLQKRYLLTVQDIVFRKKSSKTISAGDQKYSFSILFEKAKAWSGCNMLNLSRLFIFRDFGIKNGHGIIPRKGFWTVWDKYQS